jgi:hypothetical protein
MVNNLNSEDLFASDLGMTKQLKVVIEADCVIDGLELDMVT